MTGAAADGVPRRALVCGASGFIGSHLMRRLKAEGYWIRGVDIRSPRSEPTAADEFHLLDLRDAESAEQALALGASHFDEVYQLAADMGGMGFILSSEADVLRNNVLIDVNMADATSRAGIRRYFYSSSVCVYRDMAPGEPEMVEDGAYPALPDNEYGWEKLYAERVALTFGRRFGFAVRVGRFENCYGPEGVWRGGREKAPAALCRKVAQAADGESIEVWGAGSAIRSFVYIDDLVDGIVTLTQSDLEEPANIGTAEFVTVDQLASMIAQIAGKNLSLHHVDGPAGVQSRNFSHARMHHLGWQPKWDLRAGLAQTYSWIETQLHEAAKLS